MEDNVELIGEIAQGVARSDELDGVDWAEVSVVFEINPEGRLDATFGYAYEVSGRAVAVAPRPRDFRVAVEAYREWLRVEGDEGFSQMLFQLNRDSGRYKVEFEFGGMTRWQVTPANFDEVIGALRPNLGG